MENDKDQKLSKMLSLKSEGEEILAIASLNKDPVVSYSAELVRENVRLPVNRQAISVKRIFLVLNLFVR